MYGIVSGVLSGPVLAQDLFQGWYCLMTSARNDMSSRPTPGPVWKQDGIQDGYGSSIYSRTDMGSGKLLRPV